MTHNLGACLSSFKTHVGVWLLFCKAQTVRKKAHVQKKMCCCFWQEAI